MTKDIQNITKASLGKLEADFIAKIGSRNIFSIEEARQVLEHGKKDPTRQFLERLQRKGWILRIKRGVYTLIPLSSGEELNPQIHEFLLAMELVTPAAIAYWTALNHHGMTEQIPRTIFYLPIIRFVIHQMRSSGSPLKLLLLDLQSFSES